MGKLKDIITTGLAIYLGSRIIKEIGMERKILHNWFIMWMLGWSMIFVGMFMFIVFGRTLAVEFSIWSGIITISIGLLFPE